MPNPTPRPDGVTAAAHRGRPLPRDPRAIGIIGLVIDVRLGIEESAPVEDSTSPPHSPVPRPSGPPDANPFTDGTVSLSPAGDQSLSSRDIGEWQETR